MARKINGKALLKRKIKSLERKKYSLSSDESDSDCDEDSSSEGSDIDHGSTSESSKEEMSQDEHTSSRFSTKFSAENNKWKFSKQLKKWAKGKFLKHICDQEIKESILDNNPAPSNFLSRQKLDDYLLEVLSEAGKKDEIFSDKNLTKFDKHNGTTVPPLGNLNHLKKDNEGVIDLNMLLELVEQCVILIGQCHSRGSYFRKQRVLTAFFKDRRKVKSLLKEGAHCFEKEQKVLFGERFRKKVSEAIKLKKKTKELLKEYTKPTPAKRPFHYGSISRPFDRAPIPVH